MFYTATGNAGRNYVTREDCAAVAAAALASDFDGKRILDVTGPAPVTQDEIAAWRARSARQDRDPCRHSRPTRSSRA